MTRLQLPIGIQTFRKIREEGFYYVDKTPFIRTLLAQAQVYFLSRPRRFGKSLFLDTLKELFEGSESLFRGLDIHGHWDWSVRHPVVKISFGYGNFNDPDYLSAHLDGQLERAEQGLGTARQDKPAPGRLAWLLEELHRKTGRRAVVLVDEYDKPILDALETPELAKANRDALRGLYSVIKDCDEHVRFAFITGVSKFSKVSLFSGLNNLTDITLEPEYSAICGYTETDVDTVFGPELASLDRDAIREWYNGYSWRGEGKVYNPFDLLLLFRTREFKAHWFETGSPTFLIDTLFQRRVRSVDLHDMTATDRELSRFDVGDISTKALLFQTGYLTIQDEARTRAGSRYRLGYPNREVQQSLNESLLDRFVQEDDSRLANSTRLERLLEAGDIDGLKDLFRSFFASIPYQWYTNNDIAEYEGYYASVFYSYFAGLGFDIRVEDSTSHGWLDMAVRFAGRVYLFEFKVVELEPDGGALEQLKARRYADKYRALGEPIHLVAVEFSKAERNIAAFESEQA